MKSRFFPAVFAAAFFAAPLASGQLVINEIDADQIGGDTAEFVELYDGGAGNTALDGYVLVLFNGHGDSSYAAYDLDGYSTDASGFFVLGNEGVNGAQITIPSNGLQNGADAVALYTGNDTDFPNGTAPTTANLVDAIVYGTSDSDDAGLLAGLGETIQCDENANGSKGTESNSRTPDGDTTIAAATPTPGAANNSGAPDTDPPVLDSLDPVDDATDVSVTTNLSLTFDESVAAGTGNLTIKKVADDSVVDTIDVATATFAGSTVTAPLSASLANSTAYYVLLDAGAIEDLAGNPFGGIADTTAWTFTTAAPDTTAPGIAELSPADGSMAGRNTNLVITFDENVQLGTGNVVVRKASDASAVETIDVAGGQVTVDGAKLTIPRTVTLDYSTAYYVEVDAGVATDLSGNPFAGISGADAWKFTTVAPPAVLIAQYYEGSGYNKYIELWNISAAEVTMDGYVLTVWSNANTENWKADGGAPNSRFALDGLVIPANSRFLIKHPSATSPGYAVSNANAEDGDATQFNGDDSVVLYYDEDQDGTLTTGEILDAVGFTDAGAEGSNTSFYRLTRDQGYDFNAGSTVLDYAAVWQNVDTDTVDATSDQADDIALQYVPGAPEVPVLDSFAVANDLPNTAVVAVVLSHTWSGGTPDEFRVSELSDFSDAAWQAYEPTIVHNLSAGTGAKTLYFQLRNADGESAAVSDSIDLVDYTYPNSVMFTQYHEGAANNKYIEITNTGDSSVDLTGYAVGAFRNAASENWKISGFAPGSTIDLAGITLAAGQTMIVANNSAVTPRDAGTLAPPDLASGSVSHNGNDSYALYFDADQDGLYGTSELLDALSFTDAGNEGKDTGFVRNPADTGQGFDFTLGTSILDHAGIWSEVDIATVDAAATTDNAYLGTYPGGIPSSDYLAWIGGYDVGGQTAFGDDPDGDGATNGEEWYYFASDPSKAGAHGAPVSVATAAGAGAFTFTHRRPVNRNGATESYQWSTDLAAWTASGQSADGLTVTLTPGTATPDVAGYEVVTVTVQVTAGTPPAMLFGRLELTAP